MGNPLHRFWLWLHDEVDEAPLRDGGNGLLLMVGAAVLVLGWLHLNLEVRNAPLVRGFWRGGAFLGGSLVAVQLWTALRAEVRRWSDLALGTVAWPSSPCPPPCACTRSWPCEKTPPSPSA